MHSLSQAQNPSSDVVNEKEHVQMPALIFERHCIWLHHKLEFIWYILLPLRAKVHCSNVCMYTLWQMKLLWLCMQSGYPPLQTRWVQASVHVKTWAYFMIVKCCPAQKCIFSTVLEIVNCNVLLQPRSPLWVCHTHAYTHIHTHVLLWCTSVDTLIQCTIT